MPMAHAAALAQRHQFDGFDRACVAAFGVDHLSRVKSEAIAQEAHPTLGPVDEAHVLAVGLGRGAQPEP